MMEYEGFCPIKLFADLFIYQPICLLNQAILI